MIIQGEVICLVQVLTNYHFRFDLELDKFRVNIEVLKDPVILIEFFGLTEDWEKELKKKNCLVVEACSLTKYTKPFIFV